VHLICRKLSTRLTIRAYTVYKANEKKHLRATSRHCNWLCSQCSSCIKWHNVFSGIFELQFGPFEVRQGSVLSPILFAIYIDDIAALAMPQQELFVILYADDIMLIAPSILELEKLLHVCEKELDYLDMKINFKKSCCLRGGPRCIVNCANIVSLSGCCLLWASELRYLGVNIIKSTSLKFSFDRSPASVTTIVTWFMDRSSPNLEHSFYVRCAKNDFSTLTLVAMVTKDWKF